MSRNPNLRVGHAVALGSLPSVATLGSTGIIPPTVPFTQPVAGDFADTFASYPSRAALEASGYADDPEGLFQFQTITAIEAPLAFEIDMATQGIGYVRLPIYLATPATALWMRVRGLVRPRGGYAHVLLDFAAWNIAADFAGAGPRNISKTADGFYAVQSVPTDLKAEGQWVDFSWHVAFDGAGGCETHTFIGTRHVAAATLTDQPDTADVVRVTIAGEAYSHSPQHGIVACSMLDVRPGVSLAANPFGVTLPA